MRVVLITQNEPFYLAENLERLNEVLPRFAEVVGCVVAPASPFGKNESAIQKSFKVARIFGLGFFIRYAIRLVARTISGKASVFKTLDGIGWPVIRLNSSINSKESRRIIKSYKPDLLVSILGNEIFKTKLINLAPLGCLNLHTALLPKYRGLMPSFWVLKNREEDTGVSVFFVDEGIDSGPILVQKAVSIAGMTQEQLIRATKDIGMVAIAEAIQLIEADNYRVMPNPETEATYFSFPTRADVIEFRRVGARFY